MIYEFLYPFHTVFSSFNVFRYITFRTIFASITALLICLVFGKWFIDKLQRMQIDQQIREDGPKTHLVKKGTPTMGGMLIIFAVTVSTILWTNLSVVYVWLVLLVTVGFGLIGFLDDYRKLAGKNSRGLSGKTRLTAEMIIALFVGVVLYFKPGFNAQVTIPFFKTVLPNLGWGYILLCVFIIVGAANAVNLTDGLDGLATGPAGICFATYLLFAYFAGNIKVAHYLQIPYVPGAGELSVFCGAFMGAALGFLWFNAHPAEIFMGDVGSLSMGGALGAVALITKQEILLAIVGGVFVMETFSVIFQVGYFKLTGGKRIFRMAPIHHHFELKGWAEPKVIVRFWIISILLALLAISTLKLR
ncbi:MAG: phospho-N-acetylmuramoyl-pentapeptide-transferase [Smithellaceae bacterium]|nr:phospho-N-acetylmuramoyl-pentapeptide-transferase [Smithellaceae bacterium]MDD3257824.1 phospho-N-acetylmuramoyl-pentapeptide-transferase [Smithellaceae bacterium]MDD3847774.1 phospho-N-acetylmuramoyl-pentapeptide-transferase [Smithellaceae bacterium]HOQ71735.1 phospho-N-acetylmuramoyl-pentapeptide-transferase [Smithellaceae bacterium]HPL09373.1 phospho-N-acetylmuramoyl-pentapeptide-transferase [Smithellaceae bacterium]